VERAILQETACAIHRRLRDRDGLSQRQQTERMLGLLTSALRAVDAGSGADEDAIRAHVAEMGTDPSDWGTTDPDDRHVIAAAVVGNADILVSGDQRFDVEHCAERLTLHVMGADDFLVEVFAQADDRHIEVPLDALAARWHRPARFSRAQVVGRLAAPLPKAMAYLVDERGFARAAPPLSR
jgi:hypothetical protein